MKSPLSVDSRRRAYELDPRWPLKAKLRLASSLFAIIALGLFSASISYTNAHFINTEGNGDWTDGLALASIVFTLLYNSISLAVQFLARGGRPMHPGLHVLGDLVSWTLAAPGLIVTVAGGIFWYWTNPTPDAAGNVDCSFFFNTFTMDCNPIVYTIGNMEIAGAVFLLFIFSAHCSLFVMACLDLHRRRLAWQMAQGNGNFDMQTPKDIERGSTSSSQ